MKSKKILILNDGSSYENWGIKACIDGLENILEKTLGGFEVIGVPHSYMHKKYSWEPSILKRKVFNEDSRVAKKIFNEFHCLPQVADEFEYIADLWLKGEGGNGAKSFISMAENVDIVIFNAEGSTYRKNIGAFKGLFMLWFAKTKLNKQAYFLNGSVTLTLVDSTLPAIIKKVFQVIDGVAVREPYSYKNIKDFYPNLDNIKMYPDSVFSLNVDKEHLTKKVSKLDILSKDFFCFSLSMLPMDYRKSRGKSSLVHIINELKKIVPNAVLLAKDVEDQILKDVAKDTNSIFIGGNFDYEDVMSLLSKSKFIFSGRYHHLIFAAKVGCPCIPITSSSHKIHGLVKLFDNLMPKPIDATNVWDECEDVIKNAKNIISENNLREAYIDRAKELELCSFKNGSLLK
jgi:polysaccharide pyruvyl transferase WcaK-like protein